MIHCLALLDAADRNGQVWISNEVVFKFHPSLVAEPGRPLDVASCRQEWSGSVAE
jgi:hypothetical protein